MRAIIETGGMQFPVEDGVIIKIPKIEAEAGQEVDFDKVLLVSGPNKFALGKPYINGAKVSAEVIGHGKSDKVVVFKFKRRRKYRKKTGHRQAYTEVKIKNILA
ncbi:MAG: 50S ribosomal protein L21 [candidate division Zixibacteria bacterium 4484_95]|nr:MAG: 50S ribosomal protein L21 [candidate division Zixibacteria bacterium 4484_95]